MDIKKQLECIIFLKTLAIKMQSYEYAAHFREKEVYFCKENFLERPKYDIILKNYILDENNRFDMDKFINNINNEVYNFLTNYILEYKYTSQKSRDELIRMIESYKNVLRDNNINNILNG